MTGPNLREFGKPRTCPACGRALPVDVPPEACEGCVADRQRDERRRAWQELLARLEPAPLTRSRNLAYWSLVSAGELLEVALRYVDGAAHDALARALGHVHAATHALRGRHP